MYCCLRSLLALVAAAVALAGCTAPQRDVMAPQSRDAAITGPLDTITLITPDYAPIEKLFVDGMGLTASAPTETTAAVRSVQRALWGMPEDLDWRSRLLTRPGAPGTTKLRVLITEQPTDPPRNSWDRRQLGPYGMGFPTLDVFAWDTELRGMGYERATPEVEVFDVAAPTGDSYAVHESAFYAPEHLRIIAISRKGGLPQVGVYDERTGKGGPVYATQIVPDMEAMTAFLTLVLDLEVRSDRVWREYPEPFRFVLVHAKGSQTGHLALVEYEPQYRIPGTGVAPRPPARGMSIWTFRVSDIRAIQRRAEAHGARILHGPVRYRSPHRGEHEAMTLIAPNGFLIEVVE